MKTYNPANPKPLAPVQSHRNIPYALRIVILLLALAVTLRLRAAAPGAIDPSFDPGQGIAPMGSLPVRVIYPLADGSFLLGGYFTNYNGVPRPGLARILENGALDETFVPDSSLFNPRSEIWGITQQPDGKFIVGGINTAAPNGGKILRLTTDGSLDPTFSFPKANSTFVMAVDVRPDGLISYLSDDNIGIGLLTSDGSRLLTAATSYKPFGLFTRIRTSAEGHTFYSHNSGLFRFGGSFGLPDDAQFPVGNAAIYDFDFQSDGRIVCAQNGSTRAVRR